MRAKFKNKIKKSPFVKNIFFENFYFGLKPFIILAFLTPHGSQIATTVAILSPALPQGES
jgi:hypothetical protein